MHVPYLLIRKDTQKNLCVTKNNMDIATPTIQMLIPHFHFFFLFLLGYPFLHTTMALEKLGSRQNHCLNDGPRHRGRLRGGKEAKEKTLA